MVRYGTFYGMISVWKVKNFFWIASMSHTQNTDIGTRLDKLDTSLCFCTSWIFHWVFLWRTEPSFFKLKSVHIMWPSESSNSADVRAQRPRWQWEPAGPRLDVSVCWAEDLVSDVNGVWWCSGPCVMCVFAVAGSLCIHMCMCLVSSCVCVCLAGCVCIVLCVIMHVSEVPPPPLPLTPQEACTAGWKRSLTLFLPLLLSCALPLPRPGRTQTEVLPSWGTNPRFLWNFQRRFFPVQIPQPLNFPGRHSENNSEERRMKAVVVMGGGGGGTEGRGGGAPLPPYLHPPTPPHSLCLPLLSPCLWMPQICAPAGSLK